ncbi:hypothetical protein OUN64_005803, partial [Klebsiella pneumoniae]
SIVASPHFSAVHQRDGFLFSSFKLFRRHYFSLLNRMFVYLRHPARPASATGTHPRGCSFQAGQHS